MEYAILAGGPPAHLPNLHDELFRNVRWIGCDRGTITLLENSLKPYKAFGDFDSINKDERALLEAQGTELVLYPSEKDETDLEIALDWVLTEKPDRCWILGATGGRLDHGLANIQLLLKGIGIKTEILLIDQQNIVTLLPPGVYDILKAQNYPYVSFIAFTPKTEGITLEGFKYPLDNHDLRWGSTLCISNELQAEKGRLAFKEGLLLCIRSRDL